MRIRGTWQWWVVVNLSSLGLVAGLVGCKDASTGPAGPVARLEIVPKGLLLTAAGAKRQLAVNAYDAEGRVVAAPPISWRSTTPASIAVDGQGMITAQVQNGASQLVAEAQGVTSPPLLVAVTALPPGALAVTDAQLVGDPRAIDPSAAPVTGATYEVVLAGVDAPPPGTLVIGLEAKPVGGKVVSAQRDGDQVRVTLAVVPVKELLPHLSIKEVFDLSTVEPEIASDLKDAYEITREGSTIRFKPRPKADAASSGATGERQATKLSFKMPPFDECELDATGVSQWPVTLGTAPAVSINRNLSLDFVYTSGVGLERLVAKGDLGATLDGSLTVALGFQGTVSCTREFFELRIPIAGALSWVVSVVIPLSVGVELGGKVALTNLVVGAKAEAKAQAELGVACPKGTNCEFVRSLTASASAEPVWKKPTTNDLRVDASFAVFGLAKVGLGNPIFKRLRLTPFSLRYGPTLEGSFAPWGDQLADPAYASSYKLSLVSKGSVGVDLPKMLGQFGITDITILELQSSRPLAESPKGTLTADRGSFVAGDKVTFTVELDPATVTFPPTVGPYNVKDIILVRKVGTSSFVEAGRATATAGQTSFALPFTATDVGQTSDFSAFVMTRLLPFDNLALELGKGSSCVIKDLGTLGGDCTAQALNNTGQVAGWCYASSGSNEHAFLWDNGTMRDLGTLGGSTSRALGINDAKDVVGTSTSSSGTQRAFIWHNGAMQDLGTLGGNVAVAYAINQAGHVAGRAALSTGFSHAVLWTGGSVTDLGTLSDNSQGHALNEADQVVGQANLPAAPGVGPDAHACLFSGGGVQDLGAGSGDWRLSSANGINASGLVVGVVSNFSGEGRAASWSGGGMTVLPGGDISIAHGVNDAGVIVGESVKRAVRWKDGKLEDLNGLLPAGAGWSLVRALAINKKGHIVGMGTMGGAQRPFLLTCGP
ncbi:MAG: hypothetical protein IT371_09650 [Deltaproteobacteria bacterium]|nr:hypothetical protein [Deltaproteobacteria bacterium]